MTKPLNVALIGFHFGHQLDYGRKLADHPGTRLVAVAASPDAPRDERYEQGVELAKHFDVPHHDDAFSMLQSCRIDAVSIAVAPHLNAELVCACASNRIHVMCEKPVADNEIGFQRIVHAVKDAGVQFTFAAPATVFSSAFSAARERILDGAIGQPRAGHFQYLQPRGPQYTLSRDQAKERGRAELANFGPYGLLAFLTLFREPITSVFARMGAQFYKHYRDAGVEDLATLSLKLRGGGVGSIVVGRTTTQTLPETDCRMQIIGSEGVLNIEHGLGYGVDVYANDRHYRKVFDRETNELFVEDFIQAIAEKRPPIIGLNEAIGVFHAMEAAYHCRESRQPVVLDDEN